MDQIINAFGIDVRLIIIQLVNFFILMGALGYFLYNPILNLLKAREEKIAQGIADAEAAATARANAETEKADILTAAHQSADEVSKRAKLVADEKAEVILVEARAKAEAAERESVKNAERMREQIKQEAEAEIAKTAILATEKLLRERTS